MIIEFGYNENGEEFVSLKGKEGGYVAKNKNELYQYVQGLINNNVEGVPLPMDRKKVVGYINIEGKNFLANDGESIIIGDLKKIELKNIINSLLEKNLKMLSNNNIDMIIEDLQNLYSSEELKELVELKKKDSVTLSEIKDFIQQTFKIEVIDDDIEIVESAENKVNNNIKLKG